MDNLLSYIANEIGGGVLAYFVIQLIGFLILIWVLYVIIKNAVKKALIESRHELNYTIRKALLESRIDTSSNKTEIPDYRQEQTDMETRIKEIREKQKQEEENEWEYGKNNRREQDL